MTNPNIKVGDKVTVHEDSYVAGTVDWINADGYFGLAEHSDLEFRLVDFSFGENREIYTDITVIESAPVSALPGDVWQWTEYDLETGYPLPGTAIYLGDDNWYCGQVDGEDLVVTGPLPQPSTARLKVRYGALV